MNGCLNICFISEARGRREGEDEVKRKMRWERGGGGGGGYNSLNFKQINIDVAK